MKMKLLKLIELVYCCVYLVKFSHSARILGIFNFEGLSHFYFHETMMRSLTSAGHHVTIISPFELQHPHENITTINSKSYILGKDNSVMKTFARANLPYLPAAIQSLKIFDQDCRNVISLIQEKNLPNFDVMFVELMPMNQCFMPLARKIGIPVIGTLSFRSFLNVDKAVGHVRNPSVLPAELFYVNVKMSFYERLINLVNELTQMIGYLLEKRKAEKLFDDLFPKKESQNLDIALVFINNHASLQFTASAPNVVNIGGLLVKSAKLNSLPEQLKKFIDEAEHGVILFSLGTLASSDGADPHLTSILKNTFAKIPQRVIWKYSGSIEGISDNVFLSPWTPQKEILAHKNVIAFISHCGISSTYEAIYFSKPMILLPVFADQPSTAALLKYLGVGFHLNIRQLTEEKLQEAIEEVISNRTYLLNMEKLSRRFRDEPKSPEELVVYWTEYVLRHKGDALRSVTADCPWYQYLLLDVFAFVIIVSVLAIASVFMFAKSIYIVFRFLKEDYFIE